MTIEEITEKIAESDSLNVNKKAMKELGNNQAILLSCIEQTCNVGETKPFPQEYVFDETALSTGQQRRMLKFLEKKGYIKVSYNCYGRRFVTLLKKAEV